MFKQPLRRATGVFAVVVGLAGAVVPALAQDNPLIAARDLYAAARYDEALAMLNGLRPQETGNANNLRSIEQYRSLCLLALGRGTEAEAAIAAVVASDPMYLPSESEASPAPHATAAAVDLTLRWKDGRRKGGEQLWMGSLFDDVTALANRDRFEHLDAQNFSFSDQEARANRRLLHWLMTEEDFAGHPDEWWHFSWGDQMWAALTDAKNAHYGLAAIP